MDRTRASDTERERIVEILRQAATRGRIAYDELDARSAAAYVAVTRSELAALIEDLPGWQMFSARWRIPADPREAGRIVIEHVVPLLTQERVAVIHRTGQELVLQNDRGDTVTIQMTSLDDHSETHVWGVAPRAVRRGLQRISR